MQRCFLLVGAVSWIGCSDRSSSEEGESEAESEAEAEGDGGPDMIPPPTECSDTLDNDDDGDTDLDDCGCTGPDDDDESTTCPSMPACDDGVDNDGDDKIDYPDDPGCDGAGDGDERDALTGDCGDDVEYYELAIDAEVTDALGADVSATEGSCGGFGDEVIYHVAIPEAGTYVATTVFPATTVDTVVYIRTDCDDETSEVACNDQGTDPPASTAIGVIPAGDAYVFVDGWGSMTSGTYVIRISALLDSGEECDPDAADLCAPGLLCRTDANEEEGVTFCLDPVCSDGTDDDGDGIADFPLDPGCEDPDDDDESDDCPGDCPECADGLDNDDDGNFDYPDDPGCFAAADDEELDECIPGIYATEMTDSSEYGTASGSSNFAGTCGTGDESSGEDVYSVQVPPGAVEFEAWTTGATYYSTLYVRTDCDDSGSEVACDTSTDLFVGMNTSVSVDDPAGGTYYVFIDGYYGTSFTYTVHVRVTMGAGGACDPDSDIVTCEAGYGCGPTTNTCDPSVCNDDVDNDGDFLTDYPYDPGCSSVDDADETDTCPSGATCPDCANGADDDTDGETDYPDDPGCAAAGDDSEVDLCGSVDEVIELPGDGTDTGSTSGSGNQFTPSCLAYGSDSAPELVYGMRLPGDAESVTVSLCGSSYDTSLYVRYADCAGSADIECNYTAAVCDDSQVTLASPDAGSYYIFIDGYYYSSDYGSYTLTVTGTLMDGEPCDPDMTWLGCNGGFACQESSLGAGDWACLGTDCNDGDDDDADGLVDFPMDFGCSSTEDITEGSSACSDGTDNDIDTRTDYPNDAGCVDPYDNSEADPPTLPACGDTTDNEPDGDADYPADVGCYAASDTSELDECGAGIAHPDLTMTRWATGSTAGGPDLYAPSTCAATSTAPDDIYLYRVTSPRTVTVSLDNPGTDYDTVLFVRSASCTSGPEVECNDDYVGPESQVTFGPAAGDYYIFVTGYGTDSGNYELTIVDSL